MKSPLLLGLTALAPGAMFGQIIQSSEFFDPDFKVRRPSAGGILSLTVDNNLFPVEPVPTQTSGNITWGHQAGGHVEVGTILASVDLAAFTETTGDSLVFGRELNTSGLLGNLEPLLDDVAGASVLYSWNSNATVTGLTIVPDQLYQVSFTVTSGAGLPVDVLADATFGITTEGVTGASNESAALLDLLGIISTGASSDTGEFTFTFQSDQNLSSLDFNFMASTGLGADLLGGVDENENVLTFSGFNVEAIPEPSSAVLSGVFVGLLALRRRRCA